MAATKKQIDLIRKLRASAYKKYNIQLENPMYKNKKRSGISKKKASETIDEYMSILDRLKQAYKNIGRISTSKNSKFKYLYESLINKSMESNKEIITKKLVFYKGEAYSLDRWERILKVSQARKNAPKVILRKAKIDQT